MPQQQPRKPQSQESGAPPIGECAVCGEPVTHDDPGVLRFFTTTGEMAHVHDRCSEQPEPPPA